MVTKATATVLIAVAVSSVSAQTTVQPPQEKPPATAEIARLSEPVDPQPTGNISLKQNQITLIPTTRSVWDSLFSGVDVKCFGCRTFDTNATRPEPTNPNAPWLLQGKWRRETPIGSLSLGFVGARNFAAPLTTVTPIGGDVVLGPYANSSSAFAGPASQWSATLAYEKTLKRFRNGVTIGVIADAMLPIGSGAAGAGDPRVSAAASRAIRAGIVIRW